MQNSPSSLQCQVNPCTWISLIRVFHGLGNHYFVRHQAYSAVLFWREGLTFPSDTVSSHHRMILLLNNTVKNWWRADGLSNGVSQRRKWVGVGRARWCPSAWLKRYRRSQILYSVFISLQQPPVAGPRAVNLLWRGPTFLEHTASGLMPSCDSSLLHLCLPFQFMKKLHLLFFSFLLSYITQALDRDSSTITTKIMSLP